MEVIVVLLAPVSLLIGQNTCGLLRIHYVTSVSCCLGKVKALKSSVEQNIPMDLLWLLHQRSHEGCSKISMRRLRWLTAVKMRPHENAEHLSTTRPWTTLKTESMPSRLSVKPNASWEGDKWAQCTCMPYKKNSWGEKKANLKERSENYSNRSNQ